MWKRENWLFLFAIIGAFAAVVKVLEYFGITPKVVMPVTHSLSGLIWAVGLFVLSIGFTVFGIYTAKRGRRDLERKLAEKTLSTSSHVSKPGEMVALIDDLEPFYLTALQAICLNEEMTESQLEAYLHDKGYEPGTACLKKVYDRTALVDIDFKGRGRIRKGFEVSISKKLSVVKLGRSSELDLHHRISDLLLKNQSLMAAKVDPNAKERDIFKVKFSNRDPYRVELNTETYFRFGLYSELGADNVNVRLVKISPKPSSNYFGAHYPYRVLTLPSLEPAENMRINPGSTEMFEFLACWPPSSGVGLTIDRVDTSGKDRKFVIEDPKLERWLMEYEVTCSNRPPQAIMFDLIGAVGTVLICLSESKS